MNWFGINDLLSVSSWNTSVTTWGPLDTDADAAAMVASIKASTANRKKPFFTFVAPPGARPPTEGVPASGAGIPFGTAGYYSFYDGSASANYDPAAIKKESQSNSSGTHLPTETVLLEGTVGLLCFVSPL